MRKIKFRGKCSSLSKYSGEWVTGSLVVPETIKDNEVLIVVAHSDSCTSTYHVDKETVGQFTGVHDSNGIDIYEFDIVKDEGSEQLYVMYFSAKDLRLVRCPIECFAGSDDSAKECNVCAPTLEWWTRTKRYVVGNIYDNPI